MIRICLFEFVCVSVLFAWVWFRLVVDSDVVESMGRMGNQCLHTVRIGSEETHNQSESSIPKR